MGMFDTVLVPCPNCGKKSEFQSKSGDCFLQVFDLKDCPYEILFDVNRHAPNTCECGTSFKVDRETKTVIKTN